MYWYSVQSCKVCWDDKYSHSFSVSNGVRQGGVLSPVLFTLYIDALLNDLKDLGVGCHWDGTFVGAMYYADDIILLAPCPSALCIMLKACESFSISHRIRFNASKTQLIRFSLSPSVNCQARIFFCNELLKFCNVVCHLGHFLSFSLSDEVDIVYRTRDFLKKANLLFFNFKYCTPAVLTFLLRSYCLSLYGCSLWRLNSSSMSRIEVAFNKVLRRIWYLPCNLHTRIVHCTARLYSMYNFVYSRSCSLLQSCSSFPVSHVFHSSSHRA